MTEQEARMLHTVVVWRGSAQTGAINLDNITLGPQ